MKYLNKLLIFAVSGKILTLAQGCVKTRETIGEELCL